jgi:hypothetical protein
MSSELSLASVPAATLPLAFLMLVAAAYRAQDRAMAVFATGLAVRMSVATLLARSDPVTRTPLPPA